MNDFCPIVKQECKKDECVMWSDEKCLLVRTLEIRVRGFERLFEQPAPISYEEEKVEAPGIKKTEIPTEIETSTPEELATELVSFSKKEFPGEEPWIVGHAAQYFWKGKNIDKWGASPEMQLKVEKVERLARKQLEDEQKAEEKKRLEKEMAGLASLADSCTAWARERGLRRLTYNDVIVFFAEKGVEGEVLSGQTKRALYAKVNLELRTGK